MYKLMYLASGSGWHVYHGSHNLEEIRSLRDGMLQRIRSGELAKHPAFENVKIMRVMIVQEVEACEV